MDLRTSRPSRCSYSICLVTAVILLLPALSAQDTLTIDMVAATRAIWPREVTVNVAHQVPLLVNGKVSGSMQVSPGRVYPVRSIEPRGVVVEAMGSSLTFPPADTDILARAETVGLTSKRSPQHGQQQLRKQSNLRHQPLLSRLPLRQRMRSSTVSMESSSFTTEAAWSDSRPQPSKVKGI